MEPVKTCFVLHCANVGLGDVPSTAEELLCSAQTLVAQGSAEPHRRLDQLSSPSTCLLAYHTSLAPVTTSTAHYFLFNTGNFKIPQF